MRGIAMITSLLLGASTLAAAQPYYGSPERHEWRRDYDRDRYRTNWEMLAQGLSAVSRQTITLNQPTYFSRIRIQAMRGQPAIGRVVLLYVDGSRQEVMVRMRLGRYGQGSIDVVPDREVPIAAIRIRGGTDPYSSFAIYGEPRFTQDQTWHGPSRTY